MIKLKNQGNATLEHMLANKLYTIEYYKRRIRELSKAGNEIMKILRMRGRLEFDFD